MEYSNLFVFVLLVPVFLQIILPLAILTIFCLIRLVVRLFGPITQETEQLAKSGKPVAYQGQ
jgi:hypothetical protein